MRHKAAIAPSAEKEEETMNADLTIGAKDGWKS
jgi:hypothetical protein